MQELPQKKNFIRALSYLTGFVVRSSDNGCDITYVTQSDPKGEHYSISFALVYYCACDYECVTV